MPRVLAIKRCLLWLKRGYSSDTGVLRTAKGEQWLFITVNYRQSYVVLMQE